MMKLKHILIAALTVIGMSACNDDDNKITFPEQPTYDMTGFAKGADVSWLTQMERNDIKFYNSNGRETECMTLLRDLGMNSIRLRVWVDPVNGWNNVNDMLSKAIRANNLGMRLMIDFHYSDSWADPGQQTKPAAWANYSFEELKQAVADHTTEVLSTLKAHNITPEWVQVGNETGNGMLWDDGKASENMAQYAELNNSGYDAVKEVFPLAKVIVHLQSGEDLGLYRWLFDGLKTNGAKWDVIGMSLYPQEDNWEQMTNDCLANINAMIEQYGSEIMICEVGMPWNLDVVCNQFLTKLLTATQSIPQCLGIFYWEPQAYNGWEAYMLGAFDLQGRPTSALDAFK